MTEAQTARIKRNLAELGVHVPVFESVMFPGQERTQLISNLLSRLCPNLDVVLAKLPLPDDLMLSVSAEEKNAHRQAAFLNLLGVPATADALRGCAENPEANVLFLGHLLALIEQQQQQEARQNEQLTPSCSRPVSLAPTVLAMDEDAPRAGGTAGPEPSSTSQPEVKLMDYAASQFVQLTIETVGHLFPSDVSKALQRHSAAAAAVVSNCSSWSLELATTESRLCALLEELHAGGPRAVENVEWQAASAQLLENLQLYMSAADQLLAVYNSELSVWCESLQAPQLHGLGAKAAAMLSHVRSLGSLLDSLVVIQRTHQAISQSAPPLQAYNPQRLRMLTAQGQEETTRMLQEVRMLEQALQQHQQLQRCLHRVRCS